MKTNFSLRVLSLWLGVSIATGLLIFYFVQFPTNNSVLSHPAKSRELNTNEANIITDTLNKVMTTNSQSVPFVTLNSDNKTATSAIKMTDCDYVKNQHTALFKVITDTQSGQYAVVSLERENVALKDRDGKIIWSTNLVRLVENIDLVGERKINSMQLFTNILVVYVGKEFIEIDVQTGTIMRMGSR